MRKSCLDCTAKHLGSAAVFIKECMMGYPNYWGYVLGELDHAADECLRGCPRLAMAIREHRLRWLDTWKDEQPHMIPFEAMFDYIEAVKETGEVIELPFESQVFSGLKKDPQGRVLLTFDTRPVEEEKHDQE